MFNIENFLNLTGYDTDLRKSRRKNSSINSQEFFTPYSIVKKMCDKIDEDTWADPTKTFLEPCAGNFQFVCYIIWNRIQHGIDWKTALDTCYCVELMQDNIDEGKARVHELLRNIAPDYSPSVADEIMDNNFVCHDFFTWDFGNWCPKKEEPKKIQKDLFEKFKFKKPKKIKQVKINKPKKKKIIPDNSKQLEIDFN